MKAPTTDLCRFAPFEFELRSVDADGFTLEGYAAVFNSPTLIDSWEGRFEETIMPGSFRKTLSERTPVMQFDHGKHPLIGSIPLGVILRAAEDSKGVHIKARLSDNWLIEPVRVAIRDKAVNGMSFRMAVIKDAWTAGKDFERRAIHEVAVPELGPVVFPAYAATEVGVRSEFDNDLPTLLEARMSSHFSTDLSTSTEEPPDEGTPIEEAGVTHEPREHSGEPSTTADEPVPETVAGTPSTLAARRQMARQIEAFHLGARKKSA